MPDLDTLPQILRNSLLAYPCLLSGTAPFTPLAKELRECRLAVSLPQYVKLAVDDLRHFYFEARLGQKPEASGEEINRWFWAETAASRLVRQVAERMGATDDPVLRQNAPNIAR